jgi:hypothetical protein
LLCRCWSRGIALQPLLPSLLLLPPLLELPMLTALAVLIRLTARSTRCICTTRRANQTLTRSARSGSVAWLAVRSYSSGLSSSSHHVPIDRSYTGADCFLICFSLSSKTSLQNVSEAKRCSVLPVFLCLLASLSLSLPSACCLPASVLLILSVIAVPNDPGCRQVVARDSKERSGHTVSALSCFCRASAAGRPFSLLSSLISCWPWLVARSFILVGTKADLRDGDSKTGMR